LADRQEGDQQTAGGAEHDQRSSEPSSAGEEADRPADQQDQEQIAGPKERPEQLRQDEGHG
jgi:hypothetical protein